MPPSNRRGKETSKTKGKANSKTKNTPKTTTTNKPTGSNKKHGENSALRTKANSLLEAETLPIPLQQLLLNVFQSGLLSARVAPRPLSRPLSELVQTLKTHLYRRDFVSAFADADEELLRAYALRWSAGRALGYAGIFAAVCGMIVQERGSGGERRGVFSGEHVVCIGGGAGGEIAALAAVFRWLSDEERKSDFTGCDARDGQSAIQSIGSGLADVTLHDEKELEDGQHATVQPNDAPVRRPFSQLSVTGVDIADWSSLVSTLSRAFGSESIPSSKACPAPLVPGKDGDNQVDGGFQASFKKADVLNLTDEEVNSLILKPDSDGAPIKHETMLVTLMFTLNELFSTSIPKTTAFLLRLTDAIRPGTILLVVDSPGSYSTVALGANRENTTATSSGSSQDTGQEKQTASEETKPQRKYPMRFLLDHSLLSVAAGQWECIVSDDSRWFRRDVAQLRYQVGDGIGLEDMRFQIHVYRRLGSC
ncbi:hypothetical protein FQN50_004462 [Emmonsiellopsis sp. PD_5]|nr:hypothetical protein FQN50_004462 [Emmonsiellopsis sp. PD_5]